MIRQLFLSLGLLLAALAPAAAQSNFGPPLAGVVYRPSIQYSEGVIIGPRAGLNIPNTASYGLVGIGPDVYRFTTSSGIEGVCIGAYGCEFLTNAYATTGVGEHVWGFDNPSYSTGTGNDVGRDTMNGSNNSIHGATSFVDGLGHDNTVSGALSLHGAAGSILLGGTITVGDVLKATFATTNANVVNMPGAACSYTVVSGDTTLALLTSHFASAIGTCMQNVTQLLPDGNTTFTENGVRFGVMTGTPTNAIGFHFPGSQAFGWAITPTTSCTGTCTETLTVQDASAPNDVVVIGSKSMDSIAMQNPLQSIIITDSGLNSILPGFQQQTIIGEGGTAALAQTGTNGVVLGNGTATTATQISYSVILGPQAATGATSLINTVILGAQPNSRNCVLTAQMVVEIGTDACIPSTTANGGMSIANAIYGINNNGRNAYSTGQIGLYAQAPNATFTVGDAGGTTTQGTHIGILQNAVPAVTNGTADAHASDVAGSITLTAANPAITFSKAFATTPHCAWSSPSGTAFTAAISTTALTFAGGASGNTLDYVCLQ